MQELATLHCQALEGQGPLNDAELPPLLARLDGWTVVDGALHKRYRFSDFHHTMAFVNAIAWVSHREDHHPDLQVSYAHCEVRWRTHSVGGLSLNDFICAARLDALQT